MTDEQPQETDIAAFNQEYMDKLNDAIAQQEKGTGITTHYSLAPAQNPFEGMDMIEVSEETVLTATVHPERYAIVYGDHRFNDFTTNDQVASYAKLRDLVYEFVDAMLDKLAKKVIDGYTGWDDPRYLRTLSELIRDRAAIDNGTGRQAVDMANIAAFIWGQTQRGKETDSKPE